MSNLIYTTAEQQLEKLKSQHLNIPNPENALLCLKAFGYSNLIKGYRDPYIITTDTSKVYRAGVTFEQIYSLYMFDKTLRNAVMAAMQDLEEHIKEVAANIIAQSFGIDNKDYLQFRNYQNRTKRKTQFTLLHLLKTMQETTMSGKEPIHYYMTKYGSVPPWILFKSVYFSTIVNYIDQFKSKEKRMMARALYHDATLPDDALCKLMMDTLFICLDYRNRAAHGGRIYNYESSWQFRKEEIWGKDPTITVSGFSKLLFLLKLLTYSNPYDRLNQTLTQELNRHCSFFSEDTTYLGQILNINISIQHPVWISKKSHKYHTFKYCSGLKNADSMLVEDAIAAGYCACPKCCEIN